jgi:hypothetical protein
MFVLFLSFNSSFNDVEFELAFDFFDVPQLPKITIAAISKTDIDFSYL